MEFINTSISAAELCCKHNISSTVFQDWKDKFMQGCRQALLNKRDKTKSHAKEVENLKHIVGEIIVANDGLKKTRQITPHSNRYYKILAGNGSSHIQIGAYKSGGT